MSRRHPDPTFLGPHQRRSESIAKALESRLLRPSVLALAQSLISDPEQGTLAMFTNPDKFAAYFNSIVPSAQRPDGPVARTCHREGVDS